MISNENGTDNNHVCNPESCPPFANGTGGYYVSALDGSQNYLMSGPYEGHADSLLDVDTARDITNEKDSSGRAWFMAWGTCRVPGSTKPGALQKAGLMGMPGWAR